MTSTALTITAAERQIHGFFPIRISSSFYYFEKEEPCLYSFLLFGCHNFFHSLKSLQFKLMDHILCCKCSGKWTFKNVYLDIEHWLVGDPSTCQPRCRCCSWLLMHLLNWWLYLHQQVIFFLPFVFVLFGHCILWKKKFIEVTGMVLGIIILLIISGLQSEVRKIH